MENLIVHSLLCLFNLKASGKMKNKKVKMILTFFFFCTAASLYSVPNKITGSQRFFFFFNG